jgi:hypothetical protein
MVGVSSFQKMGILGLLATFICTLRREELLSPSSSGCCRFEASAGEELERLERSFRLLPGNLSKLLKLVKPRGTLAGKMP